MISKKLIFLYLIVFYCVNVGVNHYSEGQDESYGRKESDKALFNVVLLKRKVDIKWGVSVIEGRKERRKVNSKMRKNKAKGKPVFVYSEKYFVRIKQFRLTKSYCRTGNNKFGTSKWFSKLILKVKTKILSSFKCIKPPKINVLITHKEFKSDKYIRSKTIRDLLIRGTVELNPGPVDNFMKNKVVKIVTYNCNGLGNRQKRSRILEKANNIAGKGGIVMLQETHIVKEELIKERIKQNFWLNPFSSNSAGVLVIAGCDFKEVEVVRDRQGRQIYIVVENNDEKFLITNIYCPNDHKKSIDFMEEVYSNILELTSKYPDLNVVFGGDFNSCMNNSDFLNRTKSKSEDELTKAIKQNNEICQLIDSYKYSNDQPGFTWCRGNCYSRLDYIYLSDVLRNRIISSKVDWAFDKSDHAAVTTNLKMNAEITKGPGIVKVNTNVLKNKQKTEEIRKELIFLIQQIPVDWNGHTKLDFLKVILRPTISKYTGIERKEDRLDLMDLEVTLNDIENLKLKIIKNHQPNDPNQQNKISKIDVAKRKTMEEIDKLRNKIANEKDFQNTAKWFEYGEKSNKYFLTLNKHKSKQKLISEITDGEIRYKGQTSVIQGVKSFYEKLYSKEVLNPNQEEDEQFFNLCPKLSQKDMSKMEEEITLKEMYEALLQCKDTAPGLDGIPYSVYKVFWNQIGFIVKEAWDYSLEIGRIPDSHRESVITILPKEGKDQSDIKNWRPITLTNCDAKIITKTLALRINPMLDSIIDPAQTAYIPGRSVMDNLRSNKFLKDYCNKQNIRAALTSLDARKAFDSVSHEYIDQVLEHYGFGHKFRKYFQILYKDIKARVLVNGYLSELINIERGVKQGDALSCAIFIICIDPLIRNINNNSKIEPILITIKSNLKRIAHKACGFADDVSIICKNTKTSISQIFYEYQRLTDKSGLKLNADKTEILNINSEVSIHKVLYDNESYSIKSVESLKICSIVYSNDELVEYENNVISKIEKLKKNIKIWKSRHLTMEGKSLIVKTFGISQLIYVMQCTQIKTSQLKEIEQFIFNFLWDTKDYGASRARDRIKRSILKNEYCEGGLKIIDVECMDRALKLRQYIRSQNSSHSIKDVQRFCVEEAGQPNLMAQEFAQLTDREIICKISQETINKITDENRANRFNSSSEDINSTFAINQIAMTKVSTYLTRKSRVFLKCIFRTFQREGMETYLDIVEAAETEMDRERSKRLESIISAFPTFFRDAANKFDENINSRDENMTHLLIKDETWMPVSEINTRDLQWTLKKVLDKITTFDLNSRIGIGACDKINIIQFRKQCKNAKLRSIHFRLIHNDFFTYEKMFRFKMTNTPLCPRCNEIETTRHLIWECGESQRIWKLYNDILKNSNLEEMAVKKYEDIYYTDNLSVTSMIKMKIIQEFIQIERPKGWNEMKMNNLILKMKSVDKYNSIVNNCQDKNDRKWKKLILRE